MVYNGLYTSGCARCFAFRAAEDVTWTPREETRLDLSYCTERDEQGQHNRGQAHTEITDLLPLENERLDW